MSSTKARKQIQAQNRKKTHSVHSLLSSFKEQLCTPAGSIKGDNPEELFSLFLVIAQNNCLMLYALLATNITVCIVKELPAKTGFSDMVSLWFAVVMERKLPLKLLKCDPALFGGERVMKSSARHSRIRDYFSLSVYR